MRKWIPNFERPHDFQINLYARYYIDWIRQTSSKPCWPTPTMTNALKKIEYHHPLTLTWSIQNWFFAFCGYFFQNFLKELDMLTLYLMIWLINILQNIQVFRIHCTFWLRFLEQYDKTYSLIIFKLYAARYKNRLYIKIFTNSICWGNLSSFH